MAEAHSAQSLDFEALFNAAPGIYLVLTPDFTMVAANEARLRATMTTREQIIGRNLFEAFPDNPDDPAADGVANLRRSLERVLKTKTADTMAVQKYDIPRPESEGGGFEERYWSPVNSPVLGLDGEVVYIIHRVEDVSDFLALKQNEAQLQSRAERIENEIYLRAQEVQEANRRLETANTELGLLYEKTKELDAAKTRFFANISHELRTPLTLILGPVEKMLAEVSLPDQQRRNLEVVGRNARLLLHHVNDLLDIAKLDVGKMDVRYSEADLARLVRAMSGHFESLAEDRGIAFEVDAPVSAFAEIDAEKLQRVFLNLLSNAFKFTPDKGRIAIRLRLEGKDAVVRVEDSGPGVPETLRQIIFEPFRQGEEDATRRFGGTGLGLAIAKEFVDLLGGAISVGDRSGGGAAFEVRLPIQAPAGAAILNAPAFVAPDIRGKLEADRAPQARAGREIRGKADRALVLVVEDNREMNNFIAEGLMEFYRVARAYDGAEGLEKAEELRPDLIVTDMMMPGFSGEQLINELRARNAFDVTPIIILTAKADSETRLSLLRGGAQDVLTKPFNSDELLARVGNLLDAKRVNDAIRKGGRLSEEKRQQLLEHARDAHFVLDAAGAILEANREASLLLNRAKGALEGQRLADLLKPMNGAALAELLQRPDCVLDETAFDLGPNPPVYLDLSSVRRRLDDEELIFVSARNVTQRVASDERLRQSQKLEAMGQLTGGVAHDFNNLLTVVVSAAESLKEKLHDLPRLTPQVDAIERAVERGSQLTKRLLAFARQQKLALVALDLNEAVQRMSVLLERTLGEHIEIKLQLAADLEPVIADGAQVEDALLNLAINARDAMQDGGRLIIQTENVVLDEDYAAQNSDVMPGAYGAVYVTDTGTGMSPEVIARAFEPFFTTKDVGKGTGLGLSMVYGLAKQTGGHLKIYSEIGHGTSVRIYLPRAGSVEKETREEVAGQALIAGRGERVLVVEDDPAVRAVAASMLSDLGYQVTLSEDGPSALQRLEAGEAFALLFSDVVMPRGMSGIDLGAEVRSRWPEIKVLLTSGYSEEFFKHKSGAPPDFPLITKPYRRYALAAALRALLDAAPQEA